MKFTLNSTVAALVPENVMAKVQNGLDTEFSDAVKAGLMEVGQSWKGSMKAGTKDRPEAVKVKQTLKTQWTLRSNPPGRLILLSIYMDQLEKDCGELAVASLPDFAVAWFKRLEKDTTPATTP